MTAWPPCEGLAPLMWNCRLHLRPHLSAQSLTPQTLDTDMTSTVQGFYGYGHEHSVQDRVPALTELTVQQGRQQHYNMMSKTGDMRLKPCVNSRPNLRQRARLAEASTSCGAELRAALSCWAQAGDRGHRHESCSPAAVRTEGKATPRNIAKIKLKGVSGRVRERE